MSRFTIALVALALSCGCGKGSNPTSPPAPEKAKMTEQKLDGAWRSAVADAPLRLTAAAAGYTVDWAFTTDSDNQITGALARVDDHTWRGTVHLKAGDESKDAPLTLRFDPAAGALHMEFPALFADPIDFARGDKPAAAAKSAPSDDCVAQAIDVLAATTAYKKLDAGGRTLQTMKDGETSHDRVCDVRVFVDADGGETQTVGRFRVDFKAKQVLQYNPAEDSYTPLAGTAELFKH